MVREGNDRGIYYPNICENVLLHASYKGDNELTGHECLKYI